MSSVQVDSCISWRTSTSTIGARSASFTVRNLECRLEYYKVQERGSRDSEYRLYLSRKGTHDEPFEVYVQLIIATEEVSRCRTTYGTESSIWTPKIIWKSSASEMSEVVANFDQQELLFRVTVLDVGKRRRTAGVEKSVQTPTYLDAKFELENLSRDFTKLLEDGGSSHPDVELVCGDSTFKAHGSLLSVRSDVFRTMLQTDMLESKTGRVEIRDADPDTFQEFLQYLYSGQLPELTVDTAIQFYEVGDRYLVAGLKERCEGFLVDNLTRSNACSLLVLADRHSDQEFRQSVISYVLEKKIPLYDEYWSDFRKDNPSLALEIYDKLVRRHVSK